MTLEPAGGTTTVVPAWAYWVLVAISAGLPVVLASEILPDWVRVIVAFFNAAGIALVGSSMPKRSPAQESAAVEARKRKGSS